MAVIQRIEAFHYTSPIDPPRFAGSGPQHAFAHIAVRLTDSDGVVGYGEGVPIAAAMHMLEAMARELVGVDPMAREAITSRLRWWLTSPFAVSAMSIALDDLVARRLGISVASLYGGPYRTRVEPYAASYGSIEGRTLEFVDRRGGGPHRPRVPRDEAAPRGAAGRGGVRCAAGTAAPAAGLVPAHGRRQRRLQHDERAPDGSLRRGGRPRMVRGAAADGGIRRLPGTGRTIWRFRWPAASSVTHARTRSPCSSGAASTSSSPTR